MAARRNAVTLIELLVVVAILGILAGLLLPAIQSAREASRRAECLNNQRQLALAVLQFDQVHHRLPGYNNLQAVDSSGQRRLASWVFLLLPYLENQVIYDYHCQLGPADTRGQSPNFTIPGLACPSDYWATEKSQGTNLTATSYVTNCGQVDVLVNRDLPPDWRANGVFQHRFPIDASGKQVRTESISVNYISGNDGSSKTLLLSENVDAGFWTDTGEVNLGFVWEPTLLVGLPAPATIARINERTGQRWEQFVAARGVEWQQSIAASGLACIGCGPAPPLPPSIPPLDPWEIPDPDPNDPDPAPPDPQPYIDAARLSLSLARPSSYHPNGVVATFVDGHAEFVSDDLDYLTYCRLMTSNGAKATEPGTFDPVPAIYLTD